MTRRRLILWAVAAIISAGLIGCVYSAPLGAVRWSCVIAAYGGVASLTGFIVGGPDRE